MARPKRCKRRSKKAAAAAAAAARADSERARGGSGVAAARRREEKDVDAGGTESESETWTWSDCGSEAGGDVPPACGDSNAGAALARREGDLVNVTLERSRASDARTRQDALKEMCPCHVYKDIPELWDRIFEMTSDPDPAVRDQALHAIGDGSPAAVEDRMVQVTTALYSDPDPKVRKKARKMLNSYRYTGKWNVL